MDVRSYEDHPSPVAGFSSRAVVLPSSSFAQGMGRIVGADETDVLMKGL
jgi:hypothetical protein